MEASKEEILQKEMADETEHGKIKSENENGEEKPDLDFEAEENQTGSTENKIDIASVNSPVQTGGTQNNYFSYIERNEQVKKIKKSEVKPDEILKYHQIYVEHVFDIASFRMLCDNPVVIITGEKGIGRYTFALHYLIKRGYENIVNIYNLNIHNINDLEWRDHTGYIVRYHLEAEALLALYHSYENELTALHSCICVISDGSTEDHFDKNIERISLKVQMPDDKITILKNHILYELRKVNYLENIKSIEELLEQIHHSTKILPLVDKIHSIHLLERISYLTVKAFIADTNNISVDTIFQTLLNNVNNGDNTIHFVAGIEDIQERLFILVISCLDGFTKKNIYREYLKLEKALLKYFNKSEIEQTRHNFFWSLPWSQRLNKIGARIEIVKNSNTEEEIEVVYLSGKYEAQKVVTCFLQEYDWYETVKKWMLTSACRYNGHDWKQRYEMFAYITGLTRISLFHEKDMQQTLHKKSLEQYASGAANFSAQILYLYAGFLREKYDTGNQDEKRRVLKLIHEYFTSSQQTYHRIGLKICDFAFADIYLKNLEMDILAVIQKQKNMQKAAAYSLFNLIYHQEENKTLSTSIFQFLNNQNSLWKQDTAIVINHILYYMVFRTKKYYDQRQKKNYNYPVLLFVFGKNKDIRPCIVAFFTKALMNQFVYDQVYAFLKCTYEMVNVQKSLPNMEALYNDFAGRIKAHNRFCADVIRGMEEEYRLLNT